jgi:hypothetical protein
MDKNQPWNQMGQGYRPGQGYFQQRPFNRPTPQNAGVGAGQGTNHGQTPDLTQQMEWLGGLSREDRLEAKRLQLQANFSFEGFQVVRREFISHRFDPAMTVRGNSISFNNACISKLENATYIHFLINPTLMMLVIRAVDAGERDAVRWCILKGDKRKSRTISCRLFTEKLYAMMNWNPEYRYKMQGMKIRYEGESLYLFDLNAVECFLPQRRDPNTGKRTSQKAVLPEEWQGQFGMTMEEHHASTQVDLKNGFSEVGSNEQPADEPSYDEKADEEHKVVEPQKDEEATGNSQAALESDNTEGSVEVSR